MKANHLLPSQCNLPEDLIVRIVQTVQPEKIICYGARTRILIKRITAHQCAAEKIYMDKLAQLKEGVLSPLYDLQNSLPYDKC